MRGERLKRGILPCEFALAEHGMNLLVTRPAEQHDRVAFLASKYPANACAFVKCAGNEMVPRELRRGAAAKRARARGIGHWEAEQWARV